MLVRAPTGGECWHWVERRQISWRITGGLGHPCCVLLERRTEQGKWSEAAVLASQVDPRALRASVVVPELPEGPYRVRITSPELPYDACSPPLIISHNGTVDLPRDFTLRKPGFMGARRLAAENEQPVSRSGRFAG
ncbi:hypothetical protein AS594_03955 [Streptomyces agglomeratus]|uniref:Uncharacterized protein n=1 Tax=Streptomyces agglomeratus TaxID=285458 RepID=A0A1E5P2P0_9ACTN|nr:hypothetical protein AS594_03955 [Streptomyces agglomeratus]